MGKRGRILVVAVTGVLLLLSGSLCAYILVNRMSPVRSYESGASSSPQHVLIATQGSAFKQRLVATIVTRLETRRLYVKVIDVSGLGDIDAAKWQAIVLVHTWEIGKPPPVVSDFVARVAEPRKVIGITTSGSGREKLAGVDVISSASVLSNVPELTRQITTKLDARLARP
mgnify:CR=1 FL=1